MLGLTVTGDEPPLLPRGPMNISITFRQMDASDAIKKYATDKLSKLQRFLRRPLSGKVTVSLDRKKHAVEARISSGGEHLEAHEPFHGEQRMVLREDDRLSNPFPVLPASATGRHLIVC